MHNFSRGRNVPNTQTFYQAVADATTDQLNAYSATRKLKYLDMNWLIIKDDSKKHSPYRRKKKVIDLEQLKKEFKINDGSLSVPGQSPSNGKKTPLLNLEVHEREFADEISVLMNSKSLNKGGRSILRKINDKKGASFDIGYKEGTMESDEESPAYQRVSELARSMRASASTSEEKLKRSFLAGDYRNSPVPNQNDSIVKSLAKMAENEVAMADELKNSSMGKRGTVAGKRGSVANGQSAMKRISLRPNAENSAQSKEIAIMKQVNEIAGPKLRTNQMYDSELEFINRSLGMNDISKGLFAGERKYQHQKKMQDKSIDYSNAVSVFDRKITKESDIPASVLYKGAKTTDGLILTTEKNRRLKLPLSQGMTQFLQNFKDKPGKKVYMNDPDLENKLRNEEFAKKVIGEVFEDYFVNPKAVRHPKRASSGQQETSMRPHMFPGALRGYKKEEGFTMDLVKKRGASSSSKKRSPSTKGVSNEENKPLATLIYERFRSKLPEVHQNKLLRPSLNIYDHKKIELDNSTSRMRNYDSWYVEPEKRFERLQNYVLKVREHGGEDSSASHDRLNKSVL